MRETTALGAAIAAGFAVDIYKDFNDLKNVNQEGRTIFHPEISEKEAAGMYSRWTKAVEMSRGWTKGEDAHGLEGGLEESAGDDQGVPEA